PQVALLAYQPLARRQRGPEPGALAGLDQSDLGQAAPELRRCVDQLGKRARPVWQRRVIGARALARPMDRRSRIDGRIEILAERGTERHLVAARDADGFEYCRIVAAGARVENAGERARLGLDAGKLGARRVGGTTRGLETFARRRDPLFGLLDLLFGGGEFAFQHAHGRRPLFRVRQGGDAADKLGKSAVALPAL